MNERTLAAITEIQREWIEANMRAQNMFHGWQQRGALVGLERGAFLQIGKIVAAQPDYPADDYTDLHEVGRAAYQEWLTDAVGEEVSRANAMGPVE